MDRTQSDQLNQAEESFCAWWDLLAPAALSRLHSRVAFYAGHRAAMDWVEQGPEDEESYGERVCCLCGFEDDLGIVYDPYPVSDERGDLCCRDCWTAKVKPLREEASGE